MEKRTNKTIPASGLTDSLKPERPRRPSSYDLLKQTNPGHHLVTEYDEKLAAFEAYWTAMTPEPKPAEPVVLKKLTEVDIASVYSLFKLKFHEEHGKAFNPDVNGGEVKKLAFTLLYYFFRSPNFFDSPLLVSDLSEPSFAKGLLVIGGAGCGKTAVFKAIRKMFFDARRDPDICVKDIDGDAVSLRRYQRLFGYYSANDVVTMYESATHPEEKTRFWDTVGKGEVYFDDLLSERTASNYGKVELFKDILEIRYDKNMRTHASINNLETPKDSVDQFLPKYGFRVHDRAFDMFNVLDMQGKSLRK